MARTRDRRSSGTGAGLDQLDLSERRTVLKAVNRGRAVDDPRRADMAVALARRQQRFWRYAWLLGPVVGGVQFFLLPWQPALANAALGTVTLGLLALFWYRRAGKAEAANLELAQRRGRGTRTTRGGHIPGQRRPARRQHATGATSAGTSDDTGTTGGTDEQATLPGQRPYRPRGRKRRDR